MKRLIAVFLCLSILFTLSACEKKAAKNADKTIHFNLPAEPKTLDPQIASDSASIIAVEALFEGLARLDANNKPYPGVAEKWESNADSTEFTFTLRSSAKWSDKKQNACDRLGFCLRISACTFPCNRFKNLLFYVLYQKCTGGPQRKLAGKPAWCNRKGRPYSYRGPCLFLS
jgi:ABC-type oligopeptide transport system substrate-binding subunit